MHVEAINGARWVQLRQPIRRPMSPEFKQAFARSFDFCRIFANWTSGHGGLGGCSKVTSLKGHRGGLGGGRGTCGRRTKESTFCGNELELGRLFARSFTELDDDDSGALDENEAGMQTHAADWLKRWRSSGHESSDPFRMSQQRIELPGSFA